MRCSTLLCHTYVNWYLITLCLLQNVLQLNSFYCIRDIIQFSMYYICSGSKEKSVYEITDSHIINIKIQTIKIEIISSVPLMFTGGYLGNKKRRRKHKVKLNFLCGGTLQPLSLPLPQLPLRSFNPLINLIPPVLDSQASRETGSSLATNGN